MAKRVLLAGHDFLAERLNRAPQGAPPSDTLHGILKLLFTEREAGLVALLPIKPFTVAQAAAIWKVPAAEAQRTLEALADRAVLLDSTAPDGTVHYILPPPMAGFFEFSLMRLRDDIDQKLLSELFYQYLNVEEDFVTALFTTETRMGRAFVNEDAIAGMGDVEVLDYERASEVARSASHRAVGLCYCRHKMSHVDKDCDAPKEICLTFNTTADSLARHGYGREIGVSETLDLLQEARDRGLVQLGENAQRGVNFICNCCGCCCEGLIAARKVGVTRAMQTTAWLPVIDEATCNGCGKCVNACPVEAMSLVSAHDPNHPKMRKAMVDPADCLGCGVCARACSRNALHLDRRAQQIITPVNSVHRTVLAAIDRGVLQNLVFDNQALASHRLMAAILGGILRLPPIKQTLANQQLRSHYLGRLIERVEKKGLPV
ncbi:MAG TPA: 4Fe-4S dicluster domain-containing protein [Thermoflexales bacterium]|jgi:ferredoxin|nr:4Fe-4S dicluster domain-containing protein [Thermoflexales bacterium]HQX11398.1 4Fe-4S dicluster domain-containing protein [Thermoflexales bacterium]HQY26620.1 4Fe-4S dicluster domain-containing protein [Thermoflexales bacterium]HQZ54686.1 4Fe-4S dicluster domain-containing protein [Thermoflexales bacterium]HRA53253.1 4Fe-4S dicluster domain-containing protein [Thermoflexales bacterium]